MRYKLLSAALFGALLAVPATGALAGSITDENVVEKIDAADAAADHDALATYFDAQAESAARWSRNTKG